MKNIFFLFAFILLASCSNDDDFLPSTLPISNVNYDSINEVQILTYLTDNDLTAEKTASGLYYMITEEGDGENPTSTSNVTLAYKGYFLNDEVFDQSDNIDFSLTSLISGFSEGTQLLKEGGAGTFILPSRLAYGNTGAGSIAPGEVIVFDIELITIN